MRVSTGDVQSGPSTPYSVVHQSVDVEFIDEGEIRSGLKEPFGRPALTKRLSQRRQTRPFET